MYTLGIDIGSTSSKTVILEDGIKIAANVDDGVHLWKKKMDSFCVTAQLADLGVGFWTG